MSISKRIIIVITAVFLLLPALSACGANAPASTTQKILSAPVGITIIASGSQNILKWLPVQGAISYNVYSSTAAKFSIKNASVSNTILSALSIASQGKYYKVTAVDNDGNESTSSAEVNDITLVPPPPPVPLVHEVIVGFAGTVLTSSDDINWTSQLTNIPTTINLISVTYANNIFVAVGTGGSIYTSLDGLVWTSRNSGTTNSFTRVRWLGSQFVAVGLSGTIITSPDGITWTQRNLGTNNYLSSITWSNTLNLYVAAGGNGSSGLIFTSHDAINWTPAFTTGGVGGSNFYNITWSAQRNEFVAIGGDPTISILYTSSDGISWIRQNTGTSTYLTYIMWDGTQYIIAGGYGLILTSTDGIIWVQRTSSTANFLNFAIQSIITKQFSILGQNGTILKSTDGILWNTNSSGTSNSLSEMAIR